ncbi:hypothetical protein RHMOL_Rhmol07G0098200 [Rhododendron molle]|uniref:Uncharacterized protein n=1 Tax=Rhododendron molle TaxID=49168 RepID=A0ACC0MZ94_RHOML|nr:hypothetical protein RHMOL_Rhmol07G0098200 [Rhododendron molle]
MLQKLSAPRRCSANIKAYNYDYGGINHCKFNINSIFHIEDPQITAQGDSLTLYPETP